MKHFRLFLMAAALFTCTTTVDAQTLRNSTVTRAATAQDK